MIDSFEIIDKLSERGKSISDNLGLSFIFLGRNTAPGTKESYVREKLLEGGNLRGISNDSSETQISIYQISIYVPRDRGRGPLFNFARLIKEDLYNDPKVSSGTTSILVLNVDTSSLMPNTNHNALHLSVKFRAIG